MERKELDEVIEIFKSLYDIVFDLESLQPMLDRLCEITNRNWISAEEILQELERNPDFDYYFDEQIIKPFISRIEEKLKLEDEDYFYNKLPEDYIYLIGNDKKKIELMDNTSSEYVRAMIIVSLRSDEKKIDLLDSLKNEGYIVEVLKNLKEKDRIRLIDKVSEKHYQSDVIGSLSKQFLAELFSNEELRKQYREDIIQRCKIVYETYHKIDEIGKSKEGKYNSFGLPKEMTIGIEIEAEGKISQNFKDIKEIKGWKIKGDQSLKDGIEIISPIMHDMADEVKEIYQITEMMTKMGLSTNERCGGHVHIGANYLKSKAEFDQLSEIYGSTQKIFYLISNKPGELPREEIRRFASPNGMEENNRFSAVRLKNIDIFDLYDEKATIEFRLSNGTINPDIWIENIRLYGRTVQMAHELGKIKEKIERGETITEAEKRKWHQKEILKRDIPDDEKMEALMQLLFKEEEQEVYQERYRVNKELDKVEHRVENFEFGKVDFKNIYEKVKIPQNMISDLNNIEMTVREENRKDEETDRDR